MLEGLRREGEGWAVDDECAEDDLVSNPSSACVVTLSQTREIAYGGREHLVPDVPHPGCGVRELCVEVLRNHDHHSSTTSIRKHEQAQTTDMDATFYMLL